MKTNTLFFLISGFVLAVTNYLAVTFYLFWYYPWLDIPMHFIGGATAVFGWFVLADLRFIGTGRFLSTRWLHLDAIIFYILSVAVAWEVFERVAGLPKAPNYPIDTAADIFMGLIGGTIAYLIARSFINNHLN